MSSDPRAKASLLATELDETNYPAFRDHIRAEESAPIEHEPRHHYGYPRISLEKPAPRRLTPLDGVLTRRRSRRALESGPPNSRDLARLLWFAHGAHVSDGRGPTPSSGKLNALELYLASFEASWLPQAIHHYDRGEHCLWEVAPSASRKDWLRDVPSLAQCEGGALLWILVADFARVERKYGHRATKLLMLEAGHLMQNLCLLSESIGHTTLPFGGFFERAMARRARLHTTDSVLYVGLFG